jgi:hypothetical protein
MEKRCFLCMHKMDESTGLCTNPDCVRSQPLPDPNPEAKTETTEEKQTEKSGE